MSSGFIIFLAFELGFFFLGDLLLSATSYRSEFLTVWELPGPLVKNPPVDSFFRLLTYKTLGVAC